jgi:hypothetical protein
LAGCHYIGKDKGDLGKLPVEDHKSTVCMISGCSAAFGKGNGPKKVILSLHYPPLHQHHQALSASRFIAFWKIRIGLLLCRGCRGKLRNRLKTNITRFEFNTVYYFLLFMSSCSLHLCSEVPDDNIFTIKKCGRPPKRRKKLLTQAIPAEVAYVYMYSIIMCPYSCNFFCLW